MSNPMLCINETWLILTGFKRGKLGFAVNTEDELPDLNGVLSCCLVHDARVQCFNARCTGYDYTNLSRFDRDVDLHKLLLTPLDRSGKCAYPLIYHKIQWNLCYRGTMEVFINA